MKKIDESKTCAPKAERTAGEKYYESLVFNPPVYRQRYYAVGEIIKNCQAKKVLDFGCAEGKLVRYLINDENSIEVLIGVDIDTNLLEMNQNRIKPFTYDFLMPRDSPLTVSLYQGSIAEADRRFCDFDVVACVELIEHLTTPVLEMVPSVLLGKMSPRVVVVTTPNADFNVLFTDLTGFRHWDHKFEWTRNQFQNWAEDAARVYGYSVSFRGIGEGPKGSEALGCCSQMAIFHRDESRGNCRAKSEDIGEPYALIAQEEYPYRKYKITEEKKILNEIEYQLWFYYRNHEDSDDENEDHFISEDSKTGTILILLERLFRSPTLSRLCGTIDRLRSVIKQHSEYRLNELGDAILWKPPEPEWSSDDYDDDCGADTVQHPSKAVDTTGESDSWEIKSHSENRDDNNWDDESWD